MIVNVHFVVIFAIYNLLHCFIILFLRKIRDVQKLSRIYEDFISSANLSVPFVFIFNPSGLDISAAIHLHFACVRNILLTHMTGTYF